MCELANKTRLKKMIKAGNVTRFHAGEVVGHYDVAQHTFNMLVLLDNLYHGNPPAVLQRAILYHDLHEVETGDIPYPMKHRSEMMSAIGHIEHEINVKYEWNVALNEKESIVLKALDMLEFILHLTQQRKLGNTNNEEELMNANQAWDKMVQRAGYTHPSLSAELSKLHSYVVGV